MGIGRPRKYAIKAGDVFGMLTVVEYTNNGRYRCSCTCGTVLCIEVGDLVNGRRKSCYPCATPEKNHGMWRTPEYVAYYSMIKRCTNPKDQAWPNYGGRGITICDRWRYGGQLDGVRVSGFRLFYADLGKKPSPAHSLGRIDNDGPYSPENVSWQSVREQNRNKRDTRLVLVGGRVQCMADWAGELQISTTTIRERIRRGWSAALACSVPRLKEADLARFYVDNKDCVARIAELEATIARLTAAQ